MKLPSLDRPVTSAWLDLNGRRLDSSPYVSGAFEAKVLLETLRAEKVPLRQLTVNIFTRAGKDGDMLKLQNTAYRFLAAQIFSMPIYQRCLCYQRGR